MNQGYSLDSSMCHFQRIFRNESSPLTGRKILGPSAAKFWVPRKELNPRGVTEPSGQASGEGLTHPPWGPVCALARILVQGHRSASGYGAQKKYSDAPSLPRPRASARPGLSSSLGRALTCSRGPRPGPRLGEAFPGVVEEGAAPRDPAAPRARLLPAPGAAAPK